MSAPEVNWENILVPSQYKVYERSTVVEALKAIDSLAFSAAMQNSSGSFNYTTSGHVQTTEEDFATFKRLAYVRAITVRNKLLSFIDASQERTQELDETIFDLTFYDPEAEEAEEAEEEDEETETEFEVESASEDEC